MAECILLKSNGGDGSDDCTATKAQVLTGHTAITQDSDDEPVVGTMPNRGAWTGSVAMNGSVAIPQGHHNGAGKVNGPSITDRGAWSTNIGVNARVTIPKGYHNGAGSVGQSIAVQGAETDGDRAWATNMSAGEGQMNFGVRNGHYLNGVNWIRGNIPNYYSHNIKKGVNMGGLVGTFEGYVPDPTDLYNRGYSRENWNGDGFSMQSGQIKLTIGSVLKTSNSYNLAGYKESNIEGIFTVRTSGIAFKMERQRPLSSIGGNYTICTLSYPIGTQLRAIKFTIPDGSNYTSTLQYEFANMSFGDTNVIYKIDLR